MRICDFFYKFKGGRPIEASYRKKFSSNKRKNVRNDEKNTVYGEKSKKNFFGLMYSLKLAVKMALPNLENASLIPNLPIFASIHIHFP